MKSAALIAVLVAATFATADAAHDWGRAEENGRQSQRAMAFCRAYVQGWLVHADERSGLLPRKVWDQRQRYWNASDCAADNYPFIALTGELTSDYYIRRNARHIFNQEQKLCNRLGVLPDDFDFATQRFFHRDVDLQRLIFGASEYCKDGLTPIVELTGPGPWLDRMRELVRGVWAHAEVQSPVGHIPTKNVEVNGDLLEVMSRLYWLTGDDVYKEWSFRLLDYYMLHDPLLKWQRIPLRDHGGEAIAGISEAYLIAAREDRARWARYRPQVHALLDAILAKGVNEDGLMYNWFNPTTDEKPRDTLSDGWGYVYNAFLTVAEADGEDRYRQCVRRPLANLHKYRDYPWRGGADEYADTVEGALNLLNRLPVISGFDWVDVQFEKLLGFQRSDGIVEGWYGDGNSARTLMMVALWKTQGVVPSPWAPGLKLGAVCQDDGSLAVSLKTDMPWTGTLRFDRPRHREFHHLPVDYPRINRFPEWFTIELGGTYELQAEGKPATTVEGKSLLKYPLSLGANESLRLTLRRSGEPLRSMRYTSRTAADATAWQQEVRTRLARAMRLDDPARARKAPTIDQPATERKLVPEAVSDTVKNGYLCRELKIKSATSRSIDAILTIPRSGKPPYPSVVCIHGHGGSRFIVHDPNSVYQGFADALARRGAITISIDVGQHELRNTEHTLIGERLSDLIQCVDYLSSLPEADPKRIGCAGLSLGGEMAMWLGAIDERIAATVSSGFLTTMDQLEIGHCQCWKFPQLRELVDWADVYSLIAPRPLLCQNGLEEPPTDFNVSLARQALGQIQLIYSDFGRPEDVELCVHPKGHVIDLPSLVGFFHRHLGISE